MQFHEKVAVITGAGGGIGKALVSACAARGALVAAIDLQEQPALDGAELVFSADVSDEAQMSEVLDAVRQQLGPVDAFFANAGVAIGTDPILTPDAVWDEALAVNLRAHVLAARMLLPEWLQCGRGCFVSTASAAGLLTQIGSAPYSVSKHASVAFAEWLSVTYGHRGIEVSCLCPMGVRTAMLEPGQRGALDDLASSVVRGAGEVLDPALVAELTLVAVEEEQFLVLPHPEVLTYFQRKATDYERWLEGMRKLQDSCTEV